MCTPDSIQSAEWVLNTAVQSLSILWIGWLFVWLFRRRAAPLRSGISLTAMLAVLFLPFFSGIFASLNSTPFLTTLPISLTSAPAASVDITMGRIELPSAGIETKKMDFFTRIRSGPAAVKFINLFGIVWGMGFILFFLRFIAGIASIRFLKKGMKEVHNPRVTRLIEALEKTFSRPHRTRVYASSQVSHPMAAGFIKPFILIPDRLLNKLQDSALRGILLHELSHIHHRDQAAGVLQRLVTALNWWNPLAYALSAAHSKAREEISDNHVLLQNDSKEYAECLINLAEKAALFKRVPVSTGLASPHIPLKERVKHILSKERIMDTNLKKSTIGVMVLAAFLIVVAIAGSRLTFATSEIEPVMEKAQQEQQQPYPQAEQKSESQEKAVRPPKLIKKVEPVYPAIARKAGVEGTVILEATTDMYGRVINTKVLRSVPLLDQAAIDAVKQWVYEPIMVDGKPRGIIFNVTMQFRLEDESPEASTEYDPQKIEVFSRQSAEDVKPPKLIRKVDPVYPVEAREAGIEGAVILEAATDEHGRVKSVKVLHSVPELDQAAIDAVKMWVYEPMVIDGEPRGVTFTVTCRFSLDDKNLGKSYEGGVVGIDEKPPVPAVGQIKPPKLIKKVEPAYPAVAKEAKVEGTVILEATTDIYGRVISTKVLRSIPLLDQAAVDAVKQWVYEPMIIEGKPRGMIFTVTCTFRLDEKISEEIPGAVVIEDKESPIRVVGDIQPPKLIKKVEPVYPEIAKQAGVEGVVILEVTTDKTGRVKNTKVLRSIPLLDQAAIDAVRQWVYEQKMVDGEPKEITFTVTVTFKIK